MAGQAAALDRLPRLMDQEVIGEVMTKRQRRSGSQMNRDNFDEKTSYDFQKAKYSKEYKGAVTKYLGYVARDCREYLVMFVRLLPDVGTNMGFCHLTIGNLA